MYTNLLPVRVVIKESFPVEDAKRIGIEARDLSLIPWEQALQGLGEVSSEVRVTSPLLGAHHDEEQG